MIFIKKHIQSCRLFTVPVLCLCLSLATLPRTSCAPTTPKPTQNITVTVPEGMQSHDSSNLLCAPARWTDVAVFFLANYVAHAATVKSIPGEPVLATLRVYLFALLSPSAGVVRGVRAIRQIAINSDTPLETAAKAGALCVVIRTREWVPKRGDVACVSGFQFPEKTHSSAQSRIDGEIPVLCIETNVRSFLPSKGISEVEGRKVHGICCLPHGYALAILPPQAPIVEICKDRRAGFGIPYQSSWCQRLKAALRAPWHKGENHLSTGNGGELTAPRPQNDNSSSPDIPPVTELSSNYSLPKCVIGVFQTLYASATLYQTTGDQIERYGFAAFGLTVSSYLVMSIINLLGTMLTPDYSCVYLVRSEIMDEASRREGAKFEGMVATLRPDPRKIWHYVEFTIDEDDKMFMASPRESISQRGLHDATDVVQREICTMNASILPAGHPRIVVSENPEFGDNYPLMGILDGTNSLAAFIIALSPIAINGGLSHFSIGYSTYSQQTYTIYRFILGWVAGFLVDFPDDIRAVILSIFFWAPDRRLCSSGADVDELWTVR